MWVEPTSNGKFKFCDRATDPITGKTRKITVTMDSRGRTAERTAREILRQKADAPSPDRMKLSELISRYNAEQERTVKASTRTRNAGVLARVLETVGDVDVEKLSAGYVRRRFMDSGKSATTLNEYLTRLKALVRWGYKYDYVHDIRFLDKLDPFPDVPRREKVEEKFLERSELAELLSEMQHPLWRDLTAFLALSGLRFGEAAALARTDVDLTNRLIRVSKTYDIHNHITTTTKTTDSTRDVFVQDELLDLCRDILRRSNVIGTGALLFHRRGHHIDYDAYRMYLHRHAVKAIGRPITPHALRHTHASLLMEAGVDIDTISARLGHADSKITREIYLHVTARLEAQRREQVKGVRLIG